MKFDDILYLIQTGLAFASLATGNPALMAFGDLGARLLRAGRDAYDSGRARGEWTEEQARQFDEELLPKLLAQPHWQKRQA